jgi:uncharacterized protein YjbI with pentapeptide repeats
MAEKSREELDALLAALNRSAERFQALWFSFIALTLYFAITALNTTHQMLLLEETQVLPLVSIKVPLKAFYFIAPAFYLIAQIYIMLMLVLLSRTAAAFDRCLLRTSMGNSEQERYRSLVENALFAQLLVGQRVERVGPNSWPLWIVAMTTLIAMPLITFLLFQIIFLPYQSIFVTSWHRIHLMCSLVMSAYFWICYRHFGGNLAEPVHNFVSGRTSFRSLAMALLHAKWSIIFFFLSLSGATYVAFIEGRWAGEPGLWSRHPDVTKSGILFGYFPDRMLLSGNIIVSQELFEQRQREQAARKDSRFVPTKDFGGRNFIGAVWRDADLRGVSLEGSIADHAEFHAVNLESANLRGFQANDANFSFVFFIGADLTDAQLDSSVFARVAFHGANMDGARIRGGDFFRADLSGVSFQRGNAIFANFLTSNLSGADIAFASLQLVDFTDSTLSGARLLGAELQGARLARASTDGLDFSKAYLFGADIVTTRGDNEKSASKFFGHTIILEPLRRDRSDDEEFFRITDSETKSLHLSEADVYGYHKNVRKGVKKDDPKKRVDHLITLLRTKATFSDAKDRFQSPSIGERFQSELTQAYIKTACEYVGGPYVARMILDRAWVVGATRNSIARSLLSGQKSALQCSAAATLNAHDWRVVQESQ